MLILTRKKGESIIIDGNIQVTIMEIEDGKVKIGIDAPREIEILRKELYEEMGKENLAAVSKTSKLDEIKKLLKKK